jgi:hypothetical protein
MTSSLTNPTSVVEGDIAILLKSIQNHTNIEKQSLANAVSRQLLDDDAFEFVYQAILSANLAVDSATGVMLTETGQQWLAEMSAELSVEQDVESDDSGPKQPYDVAKLNMETRNISVFQALRKIENGQINLQPEFQRAFVWDEVRQSRLVESVLIRIPLPAFYLDATDQVNWNVVDGLQRLTTLYNYCRKQSFKLQGLQFLRELEGLRFSELPTKYQVLIEDDTQLLFYNLMPGTPIQAKFTIFSRVNTGGLQLTPQEIRHALNQGPVTVLLGELSKDPIFRAVTKGVVETLRMSDRELILRVIAFMHLGYEEYRQFNELDAFLVHAMVDLNKQPKEKLVYLSEVFINSLIKLEKLFGKYAFRKFYAINGRRSPFNKALFEVWTTTITSYGLNELLANRDKIFDALVDLNNFSEAFSRSISSSTTSYNAVLTRFTYIEELLRKNVQ